MALLCLNLLILYANFLKNKKNLTCLITILVFVEQLTVHKNKCGLLYLLSFILLTNGVTLFYLRSTVDRTFILKAVSGYPHSQWILELVVVQTMAGCILVTRCWTFCAVQNQLELLLRPRLVSPGVGEAQSNDRRLAVRQRVANMSPVLWVWSATEALWTISRM